MSERTITAVHEGAPVIVTKRLIRSYAAAVGNRNPAYFSEEAAQEAGFPSLVAPASFHAQYGVIRMAIGSQNWVPRGSLHTRQHFAFKGVVHAGDYLTTRVEIVRFADAKGRQNEEYVFTVTNQRGEVVCDGAMTNLLPSEPTGGV